MTPTKSNTLRGIFSRCLSVVIVAFCGCFTAAQAQSSATGIVAGQISNAATQANLGGVRVQVTGVAREILSERDGSYEITGLAPGSYTVTFEYPGLDRQQVTVDVQAGGRTQRDVAMNSGVYTLEKFTVASEREGNAAAIVAQRNAANVKNVITADAFGNIAKGNVGDFLKRIPGIASTTDEADSENIVLRGMPAEFTTLEMDGTRMTGGGGGRNQSAAAVPTDMIERVEVIKATTPADEADSLGGRINLVTKSAYDRKGRLITLRAANSYSLTYGNDVGRRLDSALAPSLSANYSDVFSVFNGTNNLGIYANVFWERILDIRGTTSWGENYNTPSTANGGNGKEFPRFNNVSTALHGNDRGGAMLKADYKVSNQLSFGAQVSFNTYTNRMFRTRNQLKNGIPNAALSGDPYFVVIDGAQYGSQRSDRDRVENRINAKTYFDYKGIENLQIKTTLSAERTNRNERTDQIEATSAQRINYAIDRRAGLADDRWPGLPILAGPYTGAENSRRSTSIPSTFLALNPFGDDFSNSSSTAGQWQRLFAKNEQIKGTVDVTKRFATRFPIELKAGVSYRGQSLKQSRDDLRGTVNLAAYGNNLSSLLDNTWDLGGAIGRYPVGKIVDLDKVTQAMGISYKGPTDDPIQRWNYNPATFTLNTNSTRENTLKNSTKIFEDIYGTYVQGEVDFGKLNVLGGVRFEQTESTRNQVVRNRDVSGTVGEWTKREWADSKYEDTFPSLHLRYRFNEAFQARASYSTTAGRPNWGEILGTTDVDESNHEIDVPNLGLKPRTSENLDVALEYYFEPVGQITIGLFQKDIKNYDVDAEIPITLQEAIDLGATPAPGDTTPYVKTTKLNAGEGRVRGIELNYSQQLSFLPGLFRGLGVFGNYTYLKTEGTFDIGTGAQKRTRLQKFIPRTANAGLSYIYNRYDLRASWNYTGSWDENFNSNPAKTKVRGERWSIDFTGKYKLTRNFTLFLDLVNLTSNHGKKYYGYVDNSLRNETNALGFLATGGITASF